MQRGWVSWIAREEETCCARSYLSRIYRGELAPASRGCDRLLWLQRALPSATLDKIPKTKLTRLILGSCCEKGNGNSQIFVKKEPYGPMNHHFTSPAGRRFFPGRFTKSSPRSLRASSTNTISRCTISGCASARLFFSPRSASRSYSSAFIGPFFIFGPAGSTSFHFSERMLTRLKFS